MFVFARKFRMGRGFLAAVALTAGLSMLCGCGTRDSDADRGVETKVNALDKGDKTPEAFTYDATNGTKSNGVYRTNGSRGNGSAGPRGSDTKADDTELTQPLVVISGKVKFEDGKPVTTGTVSVASYKQVGTSIRMEETVSTPIGKDGSYSIEAKDSQHITLTAKGDFPRTYTSISNRTFSETPKRRKVEKDIEVVRGVELSGRVVDEKDVPVAGASLMVHTGHETRGYRMADEETSSSATGEFTFHNARPGKVAIIATHPDLANGRLEAIAPTTGPLVVKMLRGGATVAGYVYRQETGEPQAGVTVAVAEQETWQPKEALTANDGRFEIAHIRPGKNRISIETHNPQLGGFPAEDSPLYSEIKLADGETTDVSLFVYGGHTISGKVFDKEMGTPLPGALVSDNDKRTSAAANGAGEYRLDHVFTRSKRSSEQLIASLEGYTPAIEQTNMGGQLYVQLNSDELQVTHDIPMTQTVTVSGMVKTAEGVPVPGASVQIKGPHSNYGRNDTSTQITQKDGTYKLEARPFYEAVVQAEAEGFAVGYSQPFHIDNRDLENINVTVDVGATVQGTVIGPDGKPVKDANVGASTSVMVGSSSVGDSQDQDSSDEAGSFMLTNLPKDVNLHASHEEYASADNESLTLKPGESRTGIVMQLKTGYTISGKVVDQKGAPLEGAHVYAQGGAYASGQSDEGGNFELKKLAEGNYRVSASAQSNSATAENVKTGTNNLVLTIGSEERRRDRTRLIGTVVDSETKKPVEKFTVQNLASTAKIDPQRPGVFTVDGMMQGVTYSAEISATGFMKSSVKVEVPRGKDSFEQTFELGKGGAITGVVVEAGTGTPLPGILVVNWGGTADSYQRQQIMPVGSNTTDAEGKFTLAPAPAGDNILIIRPDAPLTEASKTVKVMNDEVADAGTIELGQGGVIYGTVTRGLAAEPVEGAMVQVFGYDQNTRSNTRESATTDREGKYRIENLPPRNYSVNVSKYSVSSSAELASGAEKEVNLHLGGVRVFGSVTRGGQPARGSISAVKVNDESIRASSSAQSDGTYEMSGLSAGEWKFSIFEYNSNSGRSHSETVMIPDVEDHEQNFTLPDITISGIVVDSAGEPVSGATVMLSQKQTSSGNNDGWRGGFNASDTSDSSGRFGFTGLVEGVYQVAARKDRAGSGLVAAVQARDGDPQDVEVQLRSDGGTLVSVALNMADGSGLQPAWCYLYGENGRYTHNATRGADGVMRITDVPPGNYRVNVSSWGFSQSERNVEIKAGETVTIEDVLYAAGAIEWTLQNADGTSANATVTVAPMDGNSVEGPKSGTAVDGKVTIRGLAPGTYSAVANSPGKPDVLETFTVAVDTIDRKTTKVPNW